jgi:hypothetical protein
MSEISKADRKTKTRTKMKAQRMINLEMKICALNLAQYSEERRK